MNEITSGKKRNVGKLGWKMFISYLLASLLPVFAVVSFFIYKNSASIKENLLQMAEPYCDRISDHVSQTIIGIEKEIEELKKSDAVYKLLFFEYENEADAIAVYQSQWMGSGRYLVSSNHTVKFYNTAEHGNIASLTNNSLEDFIRIYGADAVSTGTEIRSKLLRQYGVLPLRIGFYTSFPSSARRIFLAVEVPMSEILPSLDLGIGAGGYVYLLDGSGTILGTTDSEGIYSGMVADGFFTNSDKENLITRSGDGFLTVIKELSDHREITSECLNWKILYIIPDELFQTSLRENLLETLPLCILSVLFSLGVAIVFTRWLSERLDRLRAKTNRILKGDFDIAEPVRSRDELGELEESINEMAASLEAMFRDQYESLQKENEQKVNNERLLRIAVQAEINALRYQINPHYLFNTMESIRMHLYLKGDRETATVIQQFTASFRKILDVRGGDCSLADELDTVESYLKVQEYRLGDRFESEIYVSPEIDRNCVIPKLLLQPLVENAFSHGISLSDRHGFLEISITLWEDSLQFTVIDNGIGMSEEKLLALRKVIDNPDSSERVGLQNIAKRLQLLFGEKHDFRIESEEGVGTSVFVTIPYQPQSIEETTDESTDCG